MRAWDSASVLVIFGVALNRLNNFIVAYTPTYSFASYFPSIGEISVSVGFVSILVLMYRAYVRVFPIVSLPDTSAGPKTKYAIRGGK